MAEAAPSGEPTPPVAPIATPIVLFDGVCGLCDRVVTALIARDGERRLRYAPLQGTTAAALRARYRAIPTELSTVVLIDEGHVYLRSRAVFRTLVLLGGRYRAFGVLLRLPAWLTDAGYRVVARVRFFLFGRRDACRVPTPEERDLFLP